MTLPEVDVRSTTVEAPPDDVWAALLDAVAGMGSPAAAAYARVVGCVPVSASGPRPLAEGSTIPGFAVARIEPERELSLEGRHRFSRYALTFRLDELEDEDEDEDEDGPRRTHLAAESRAAFPGLHGRAYRLLVIRTGGHALTVGRMLASIRRRAERGVDAGR